ncbi:hypothetical protein [Bailinhaonella thermotolerans]|uniref:Uncharacterized protein n=1 Tax=Bailinhaonella thermotolerans TaxID=1070861 RepID=A0A3A4ATA9_9ACTN|nr:hypothetical protein [Bailinhaonella thermotolerans]RJL33210.1 hypothetical protein D5H75_10245 [Bailinhaonella thermotolerans]
MGAKVKLAVAAVAVGGVAAAVRRRRVAKTREWVVMTVLREPRELTGDARPDALARLAEHHEVRVTAAPGGRGSEIAVRPATGQARESLRAVKQLLETGEVLRVEGQTEGRRTAVGRAVLPAAKRLARRSA